MNPKRLAKMADAVRSGNDKTVRLLLKAGVDPAGEHDGWPFVRTAAMGANDAMFDLLVAHGAQAHDADLLHTAICGDSRSGPTSDPIVRTVLDAGEYTPDELGEALCYACGGGNTTVAGWLLERGADPNHHDAVLRAFPLLEAIRAKCVDGVQQLLDAGARPQRRPKFRLEKDDSVGLETWTLLRFAEVHGTPEIVEVLRAAGAA